MTALHSFPEAASTPPRTRRRRSPKKPSKPQSDRQWLAAEITAKLMASSAIAVVAIAGLIKLIPYQLDQQAKVKEVESEVVETERRVNHLRNNFNRHFDPKQTLSVMQEQSALITPNTRRIFFKN
jgi:predicted RND superfamily exporter protein